METSTIRNVVILGVAAVAGYFVYRKFFSGPVMLEDLAKPSVPSVPAAAAAAASASNALPLLKQPYVKKGELVGTRTQVVINAKQPGYKYYKITNTTAQGVREFKPTANGYFTGRLLMLKAVLYAECRPG